MGTRILDTSEDSSDDNAKSKARVYNKTKWKKKLKALEKTKVVIGTGKSVEAYLIDQQKQRNAVLNSKRQMTKKKVKAQQKKDLSGKRTRRISATMWACLVRAK